MDRIQIFMNTHTKSYETTFEECFNTFMMKQHQVLMEHCNDDDFACVVMDVVEEFYDTENKNAYIEGLTRNQQVCAKELIELFYIVKRLFKRELMKSSFQRATSQLNDKVDKSLVFGLRFIQKLRSKKAFNSNDIRELKKVLCSFKLADDISSHIRDFMSSVDTYIAKFSLPESPKFPTPITKEKLYLSDDTLALLQDTLECLHQKHGDKDCSDHEKRILRFLKANGVTVIWDAENLEMSTNDFFVLNDPEVASSFVFKPCLKWGTGFLRGEIRAPVVL